MTTIRPSDIEFVKEAVMWRDKKREEGVEPHTYRNEDNTHIALFMDDCDDVYVYELGPEVAYFENVKPNQFEGESI